MGKTLALVIAILAVVLGPVVLRPRGDSSALRGQDTLTVITPHNEAIRSEFGEAFREWYRKKTGRTVLLQWLTPGGTSEIYRYLEGAYAAGFENHWRGKLGRTWNNDAQQGFMDSKTVLAASPAEDTARQASRRAFLASGITSNIDIFFGGGAYDFQKAAGAGMLTDCGYVREHPGLFGIGKPIPPIVGGERYYDEGGLWVGTTIGAFGIASNRDQLARRGLPEPRTWADLADPRYFRSLALANPTQSSSSNKAFEMLIQQQMNLTATERSRDDATTTAEGWQRAMRLIQRISANARYFSDSSAKIALDIEAGEATAGMTIDFYGRFQSETVRRADGSSRIRYSDAEGGTSYGVDPIALLRGAPHPELAHAFIEFVMGDGQKLWAYRAGEPGGPRHHSLRRLPILPELYTEAHRAHRGDPDVLPYEAAKHFSYDGKRTGPLFGTIAFTVRVMCIDPHRELTAAWRALCDAKERTGHFPPEALAAFEDVAHVDYAIASGRIRKALSEGESKIEQVRLAKELADRFRNNYERAEQLAREGK